MSDWSSRKNGEKWTITQEEDNLYEPFNNKKEQADDLTKLLELLPTKYRYPVVMFISKLMASYEDGYTDDH